MRNSATTLLVFVVALELPSVAVDKVGTPLMWVSMLHLLFGNAVIGAFECALIGGVFRVPKDCRLANLFMTANG